MKYFLIFLLLCVGSQWVIAQSASPYFLVEGRAAAFPLRSTEAGVKITGVIADVTVEQTYVNDGDQPIEATYVFPASTEAAVYGFEMRIGDRILAGEVMRKAEARETYETAKAEGKRSSLLEQHRPNVFQMNVANILPGDTVAVRLKYTELLVPEGGTYRFVYPTVVGPRFTGEAEGGGDYAAQPYVAADTDVRFGMHVTLAAGMPLASVASPSHTIRTRSAGADHTLIDLDPTGRAAGNRDFVLEYRLGGAGIHTGLLLFEGEKENYFLYMAQPAAGETPASQTPAREFVFVLDVSGSMTGFPLDVSKGLLEDLVDDLRPTDHFNILLFAGGSGCWRETSVPATAANVAEATRFLSSVRGGGGTELLAALEDAYALDRPRGTDNAAALSRNFVIVTDGFVSVEPAVFELIERNLDRANVYTFGIGSGVNRHLIEGMARVGRGRPAVVLDEQGAPAEADRFRRYIRQPLLTDVRLAYNGFDAYDLEPLGLPDLGSERPLVVFGKYRGKPRGELVLSGATGAGKFLTTYRVKDARPDDDHAGLAYLWARHRIQRLDDYNGLQRSVARVEELTRLGLDFNLLTAYTSFVAVDKTPVTVQGADTETVKQALPLPAGVSVNAVGFTLGVAGVSGLPGAGAGLPWWSYVTVGVILLFFLVCFSKVRAMAPVLLALVVFTGCTPQSPEAPVQPATSVEGATEAKVSAVPAPDVPFVIRQADTHPPTFDPATGPNGITFILGKDQSGNPYYARAERYFRERGAEQIVTSIDNLAAVRYYLRSRRPAEGWGEINLVVHGNPWSGISVGRNAAEKRTTAQSLAAWSPDPLPGITDSTRIVLHGCGLGRDQALLRELSRVFGGEDRFPLVEATEQFTLFREGPRGMERHVADFYYRARPLGDYPLPSVMAVRFGRQHPEVAIDWERALSRNRFSDDFGPYLYQFNVPAEWIRVHPEGGEVFLPDRPAERESWLAAETELAEELSRIGLTHQDFRWTFERSRYRLAEGRSVPAVIARGTSRLFCVLVPVERATTVRLRYFRDA